jgi:hypothetical protein
MYVVKQQPLHSLGLGGDGDELLVIAAVENSFGIELDKTQAHRWHTAGDLFQSLRQALPAHERSRRDLWPRFAAAVAREADVEPDRIGQSTRLLAPPLLKNYWPLALVAGLLALTWWLYRNIP